jgi:hypothetical protein
VVDDHTRFFQPILLGNAVLDFDIEPAGSIPDPLLNASEEHCLLFHGFQRAITQKWSQVEKFMACAVGFIDYHGCSPWNHNQLVGMMQVTDVPRRKNDKEIILETNILRCSPTFHGHYLEGEYITEVQSILFFEIKIRFQLS